MGVSKVRSFSNFIASCAIFSSAIFLGSCGVDENQVTVTADDKVTDVPIDPVSVTVTDPLADASGIPVPKDAYPPPSAEVTKATVPVNVTKAYVRESAVSHCTSEYPDDLAIRGGCKRNAEAGAESFAEISRRYRDNPEMQRALAGCLRNYTEDGITDFALVGGCARNNENGLRSMSE